MSGPVGAFGAGSENRPSVALRPMSRDDFPALATWLRAPHVEVWWPWVHGDTGASEAVEAEYGPCIDGDDPTELFVIEADGRAGRVHPALPGQRQPGLGEGTLADR